MRSGADSSSTYGGDCALELTNVSKAFGPVKALDGVSMKVMAGEVLGLVGANGAGKTTLIRITSGDDQPDSGTMAISGSEHRLSSTADAWERGIAVVRQDLALVPALTVAENLILGSERPVTKAGLISRTATEIRANELLGLVGLDVSPQERVRDLSTGQRQLVAAARALRGARSVLLLDEPTTSLSAHERDALFDAIRRVRAHGVAVIFVSHRLDEIAELCGRVVVLRDGRVVAECTDPARDQDRIIDAMCPGMNRTALPGRFPDLDSPRKVHGSGTDLAPALEIESVHTGRFGPTSLRIDRGEVVGLYGLVGSGRSSVARAVCGLAPIHSGSVQVCGRRVRLSGPQSAFDAGISYVPEDRHREGIWPGLSVLANVCFRIRDEDRSFGFVRWKRLLRSLEVTKQRLGIKYEDPDQPISTLSGGNQQKCVIARALMNVDSVLVLDEPTQGVDIGARQQIHSICRQAAVDGVGVLMISSDASELLTTTDRILVMRNGRIVATRVASSTTERELVSLASRGGS